MHASSSTRSYTTFSIEDAIQATQARLLPSRVPSMEVTAFPIVTDSRELMAGDAFLPLVGERFDGHSFLEMLPTGVNVAFCSEAFAKENADSIEACRQQTHVLVVTDTLMAYQQLAGFHRNRINTTVIGLTGSSGKTTMKEYLLHALSALAPTQATEQNFNNDIGVARTILNLKPETRFAIIEMGMRGLGEIRRLVKFVQPDIGLIINAGVAHLECLGSVEAIAQAKCELAEGVRSTLITNADSPTLQTRLTEISQELSSLQHHRYSLQYAENLTLNEAGHHEFTYKGIVFTAPLPGVHHASNVLGVITVASVLGFDLNRLSQRMLSFQPSLGRFERIDLPKGHTLINDAYNANPESMRASLDAFLNTPLPKATAQRIAILGSMKELGEHSAEYHQALMTFILECSNQTLHSVVFIGTEFTQLPLVCSGNTSTRTIFTFETKQDAVQQLSHIMQGVTRPTEWFLKGSRYHALETLIPFITSELSLVIHP